MKKIRSLFILFILLCRLNGYSQWVQTNGTEVQSPIFALAANGINIYAASIYGFYWSTNNGTNWIRTSGTFPNDTVILSMIGNTILQPAGLEYIYQRTMDTHGLYRIADYPQILQYIVLHLILM